MRVKIGERDADFFAYDSHVLMDQFRIGAAATGDLTLLLTAIQMTSKFIATNVRKARLINLSVSFSLSSIHYSFILTRSQSRTCRRDERTG